jgi:hypothetical protein
MMLFLFIVKRLKFLRNVPFLPDIFDNLLKLYCFFSRKEILDLMDDIGEILIRWPDIKVSKHKYGGMQFNYKTRELGHIHGNGLIDIHLDKITAGELIAGGKALQHHTIKNAGWISYNLKTSNDLVHAISLFKTAYDLRR